MEVLRKYLISASMKNKHEVVAALENKAGGKITVSTTSDPDKNIVHFSDNGSGIPPTVKNRIFEAFLTTKARGNGAGIGLGIVLDVVSEHAGNITCESESGKGTTFKLSFPVKRKTT